MSQPKNNEINETESSSVADGQELQKSDDAEGAINDEPSSVKPSENASESGKDEQAVYKEVLEKLNLKESKDIQEKSMQAEKNEDIRNRIKIENIVTADFQKIENLMQLGLINPLQGQNLKNQVMKKAFDMTLQNGATSQNLSPASKINDKNEVFDDFNKSNPNFFDSDGRREVLDYLKSDGVIIGKDDLKKISVIIESLEQKAIDGYLKKEAHQKNLKVSNDAAKQKLTANAQNSSFSDKNISRTFTREQIGKMSSTEFAKYEPLIMEQLKKGLIR